MYCAANGECDIVTELISLGADVDIQDSVSHFICMSHHHTTKWFMTTNPPPPSTKCLCELLCSCPILYSFLMGHHNPFDR